jgi:hypothetical protein
MTEMEIFTNQEDAHAYVRDIQETKARLLTEAALASAVSAWLSDPEQSKKLLTVPIDLLAFARGVHAFFQDRYVLEAILSGSLTSLEELTEVF